MPSCWIGWRAMKASTALESDGCVASTGWGTASGSRVFPSPSSSAESAAVTSRSLLDAPICSSERATAAPNCRALLKRSRGSWAVAFFTSSAMLAGSDGTRARGSQPSLEVTALTTSASVPLNGRTPVRHS